MLALLLTRFIVLAQVAAPSQPSLMDIVLGRKTLPGSEAVQMQFWLENVHDLVTGLISFIPRLLVALIFIIIFWFIYRAARRVAVTSMVRAQIDQSIRDMLCSMLKWSIMGFGVVIACNQVGIQITALLAGVSIMGLAVGFAAQESLANFIAGIVIFWDKPFKIGDWLDVDGRYGKVLRVTFRSTRLQTLEGEVLIMPNTAMLAQKVTNHSTDPNCRVSIPIGIAYTESIDQARAALLATAAGDARINREPAPSVVVTACADSSVNLLLRLWINDPAIERPIFYEYQEKAKKALDDAGIEIPFPHMKVMLPEGQSGSRQAR